MCTTCGCGQGGARVEVQPPRKAHQHAEGTVYVPAHDADRVHHLLPHDHDHLHYGEGIAGTHAPGISQARIVQIEQDILSKNNAYADANRRRFAEHGIFVVNLVSAPGAGKTSLLTRTIEALKDKLPLAVIEGDQQTSQDAERIRAAGARAMQINTGKGCHLDAHMVGHAIEHLVPAEDSLLLIENVGNLVCPAAFDLGEAHKVVIFSVTEGEDKPLKYPDMFHAASLMLLNKVDLLPHLSFDADRAVEYARRINPAIAVIRSSAVSGDGMPAWLHWLEDGVRAAGEQRRKTIATSPVYAGEAEAQAGPRQENG